MISIILPCRDAEAHLGRMLRSLANQTVAEPTEIVVVDNGSSDRSRDIASAVSGMLPIRVLEATARANASYARNVGVRAAAGDKLLFVDADDDVAPGYVAAMAQALDSHEFVTSRVDSDALNAEWLRPAHGDPWQAEGVIVFFDFLPATGVNVGLRRELFDAVGGFPEDFPASQDMVFSWRIQLVGRAKIHFVREALYYYRYRATLRGLFRQTRIWGASNVRLYRHFKKEGMPGRPVKLAVREWQAVLSGLVRARSKKEFAPYVVRLGYCLGRVVGSLRERQFYL